MIHLVWVALFLMAAVSVQAAEGPARPLTGTVKSIDGQAVDLGSYTGKVVLVVNVASRCGHTRQYKQLQELYEKYVKRGLVVLGFPCNQFGQQEPGTEADIKAFCEKEFAVSFPMFSKIDVNGENAAALYKHLTSDRAPIKDQGPVKWNFEKFLLSRNGEVIARYRAGVTPDGTNVTSAIEEALAAGGK